MVNYEELLKEELKRLVKSKISVTKEQQNYLINIENATIEIPTITNRTVRKNSITSR